MTAPAPRPSASVILVRDAPTGMLADRPTGIETLMVRRHARSPVAPSAYVFPGGTLRADDFDFGPVQVDRSLLARTLSERSDTPVDPDSAAAFYASAIRELYEEAGVLLVRDPSGSLLTVDASNLSLQERMVSTRLALQARELSLASVLAERGYQPAFDLLIPFSHWVTPAVLAARFDTRFFVAEMPPAQTALHDTIELSDSIWLSPTDVLDADYNVPYATAEHLRRLSHFSSVRALVEFARDKPIRRLSPEVVEGAAGLSVFIRPELVDSW